MIGVNGDFMQYSNDLCGEAYGSTFEDTYFVNGPTPMADGVMSNYLFIDKDYRPAIASTVEYGGWMRHAQPWESAWPSDEDYQKKLGYIWYRNDNPDYDQRKDWGRVNPEQRCGDYNAVYNPLYRFANYEWDDAQGKNILKSFNELGYTGTNDQGYEMAVMPVDEDSRTIFGVDGIFTISQKFNPRKEYDWNEPFSDGNNKVPDGGLMLSVHGGSKWIMDLHDVGNTVNIRMPFSADGVDASARELIGGFPVIVKNDAVQEVPADAPAIVDVNKRRARTAVGYNADKTRMIMTVVEETNPSGMSGMTVKEMGNVMKALGCSDALNFEGGRSSLMQSEYLGQRSMVRGGFNENYVEPVINGLFAVSTAPKTGKVARIEFADKVLTIKPGAGYQPVIYAYNEYGAMISAGLHEYSLSAPEGNVTFIGRNRKMIAGQSGYFALTATYCGKTTSIPVLIDENGIDGDTSGPEFSGNEFVEDFPDASIPAGIDDVTVDNGTDADAPVEYYNLQGIRVVEPKSGVYIRRQGSHVSKMIVK